MSVPIRRRRPHLFQMRFMARLHFVWSYYGEHLGLRIFMAYCLLQVLLFLLPATAAAAVTATVWLAALLWLRRLFIDVFHTSCLHE